MPTDPAPEKEAALAAPRTTAGKQLLANIRSGVAHLYHDDPVILDAIRAIEDEAAGYDVARIEEGERPLDVRRLVKAIGNIAKRHGIVKDPPISQSVASIWGYSKAPPEMDAEIAREYAALAASDEAVRS